jgi:hypothetical protein
MPFFELGSITVALTFSILCILGVGGIVVPLARLGWHTPGKARVVLYFGGLGAGFMFVEIGLMLSAHAWLGSPVLAAAFVLTALLVASGVGSLWSEKFLPGAPEQKRTLIFIGLMIVAIATLLSRPCAVRPNVATRRSSCSINRTRRAARRRNGHGLSSPYATP